MIVPDHYFTRKEQLPEFHRWRAENKNHGFVFNRSPKGKKAAPLDKIHHASCKHVWGPRFTPCATWGKVCHHDLAELISWAEAQRPFEKKISEHACTDCFGREGDFESQWEKSKATRIPLASDLSEPPQRIATVIQRIVRDSALARQIKAINGHQCQLCSERIELPNGRFYSEAHHLKPLGTPMRDRI